MRSARKFKFGMLPKGQKLMTQYFFGRIMFERKTYVIPLINSHLKKLIFEDEEKQVVSLRTLPIHHDGFHKNIKTVQDDSIFDEILHDEIIQDVEHVQDIFGDPEDLLNPKDPKAPQDLNDPKMTNDKSQHDVEDVENIEKQIVEEQSDAPTTTSLFDVPASSKASTLPSDGEITDFLSPFGRDDPFD
jgi:hypothetical protein